jgi:hypothetical protein
MAEICPLKVNAETFQRACTTRCPLWCSEVQMCSMKATALLLHDIHSMAFSVAQHFGIIGIPTEEKEENIEEKGE